MNAKTILTFLAVLVVCGLFAPANASAADQPVKITTLVLNNGDTVKCAKCSSATVDGATTYMVVTLEGKRASYADEEVKSQSTETVDLSTLPESAQKLLSKNPPVPAKTADEPATAGLSDDAKKAIAKGFGEIADERKKYEAAVAAITDEGRKALDQKMPLDQAAQQVDAQVAQLDSEIDQAQRGLNNPQSSKADRASYDTRMKNAQTRKAGLMQQKTDADKAAADIDAKVADLVATKEKKLEKLKADFDAKSAAIKAKYAPKDNKDSKDAAKDEKK